MAEKRKRPNAPAKRPVGRPRKQLKTTTEAPEIIVSDSSIPPKTRKSRSTSAAAAASTSSSASRSTSASEILPHGVLDLDSDSEIFDDPEADDVDAAAIDILGRADADMDYVGEKQKGDKEEEGINSDDEDEEQEEEAEEEDIVFNVEFVIPVTSSATDTLTYKSDITHADFTQQVADEMNIRRKELEIGYKFSNWTKDVLPRVIKTPIQLIRLFNAVQEERKARAGARTAPKKPLQVNIIDLPPKESEKPESKKTTAKKPKSKTSKKADSSDDESGEALSDKKKTAPQYLRELEALHKCERHGGCCLVAKNGEHIALGAPNLSLWSMLCAQAVHDSTSVPPPVMGLPFETGTQAAPRSRAAPNHQPLPPPAPYPYPYHPPAGPYPHAYHPPPPLPPSIPAAPNPPPKLLNADADSDDDEAPTLFPKIEEWLLDLDTSERGEDGHGFGKFGKVLRDQGFARVVQIPDLNEKDLMAMCEGMSIGVAKLLIKYAKADCRKIRKQEAERKVAWASRE
ncbi:hypothetical protein B0H11DRAFT_2273927 [Mycena galericulata]|nr:hypothetical protein B0H11DRAFT_2273927 [Mycena galericulata]